MTTVLSILLSAQEDLALSDLECAPGAETAVTYVARDGEFAKVMSGIPMWMLVAAVAAVILSTFGLLVLRGAGQASKWRFNLIKKRQIYRILRSPWFQPAFQLPVLVLFAFIIYAGLFGSSTVNIAPVLVWTIWWAGLIVAVLFLGPVYCFVCPWDACANIFSRLSLTGRGESISLGLNPPAWLHTVWPATILFALLSWAELGLGITSAPKTTAYLGLLMSALAIAFALVFDKKIFCKSVCPVGRIQGLYANFSPVELRARKIRACETCMTEDCLNGNERGHPCPTGISLKVVQNSSYCTGCTECIKTCNRHNVALNLRSFGGGVSKWTKIHSDEAWLCIALLSLTLFHGLTMTTTWENFAPGEPSVLKWLQTSVGLSHVLSFSLAMLVACSLPILGFVFACWLAARFAPSLGFKQYFLQFSAALLPVALFYHLAHNAMHLLMEGTHLIPLLSDPLGQGKDLFGTTAYQGGHLLSETSIGLVQVFLIATGHVFGVVAAHRVSERLLKDKSQVLKSLIPITVLMVLLSIAGLSLMVLDMNMRSSRM